MKIKKAVIPVAGKGTRFLPATKEVSKEMLPLLKTPMIHYVVSEAIQSGLEEIIFVTSKDKPELENYFKRNKALESFLEQNGKVKELELIKEIGSMVSLKTVEQKEQLGLGHAILMAEDLVGGEDFAVLLGDDLIFNDVPVTKQLVDQYEKHQGSVIGVMEVPNQDTNKYGIVAGEILNEGSSNKEVKMDKMVEKPNPSEAPTNLATPGRYILKNKIFEELKTIPRGAGGEYQLTDAINSLCTKEGVFAYEFTGNRFDTGNIKGYFDATIELALQDPELRDHAFQSMKDRINKGMPS